MRDHAGVQHSVPLTLDSDHQLLGSHPELTRLCGHGHYGHGERVARTRWVGDALLNCGTELRHRGLIKHGTNVIQTFEVRSKKFWRS